MKKFVITVIMCLAMIFADFSSLLVLAEYTEPSEKDPAATETNENNNTETTNNAVESEADIESTIETTAEPTSVPDESETVEKEMQEKANAEEKASVETEPSDEETRKDNAAEAPVSETEAPAESTEPEENDPLLYRINASDNVQVKKTLRLRRATAQSGDTLDGSLLTHNSRFDKSVKRVGIDVSVYQGNIDWEKVKNAGVDFAFIRAGYRGYSDAKIYKDKNFDQNIKAANEVGIKVGVYFFSRALNEQEAAEEANFTADAINQYRVDLPVIIDYEFSSHDGDRLNDADLSVDQMTKNALAFCNTMRNRGYSAGDYSSKNFLVNHLDAKKLTDAGYIIWLAHWTKQTDYTGEYTFWQHCGGGANVKVNGINSVVDCDIWYDKAPTVYKGVDYSSVYDYFDYINTYPDIRKAYGVYNNYDGALEHFVLCGMNEGRQGSENFNVETYRKRYPDLRNAYGKDNQKYYYHYIYCGKSEGRDGTGDSPLIGSATVYKGVDYSSVYNYDYYIKTYPDLKKAFGDNDDDIGALRHFVESGMSEGREGSEKFNVKTYRKRNVDLRIAFGNDLRRYYIHYLENGIKEGRNGAGTSELIGAVTNYKGVDYSSVYNYDYYIKTYPDLKKAFGDNDDDIGALRHFVLYGMNEGRQASENFELHAYKNRYADLRNAYGNNNRAYYLHYIYAGKNEGRTAV